MTGTGQRQQLLSTGESIFFCMPSAHKPSGTREMATQPATDLSQKPTAKRDLSLNRGRDQAERLFYRPS